MSRALIILATDADRQKAARWIANLPAGTRVEFKKPRRSIPQNDLMWAALTDIAEQLRWHGVKLVPDDWKLVFLDALKREIRIVPNIDGTGFVNLGRSSSDLSKEEMSDLIELIHAFGAKHGVVFHEPATADSAGTGDRNQESPGRRIGFRKGGNGAGPSPVPAEQFEGMES